MAKRLQVSQVGLQEVMQQRHQDRAGHHGKGDLPGNASDDDAERRSGGWGMLDVDERHHQHTAPHGQCREYHTDRWRRVGHQGKSDARDQPDRVASDHVSGRRKGIARFHKDDKCGRAHGGNDDGALQAQHGKHEQDGQGGDEALPEIVFPVSLWSAHLGP
jgi:hypothetical protein